MKFVRATLAHHLDLLLTIQFILLFFCILNHHPFTAITTIYITGICIGAIVSMQEF